MDVSNEAPDWKAPNKKMKYAIESFWKPSKFKPETISIETGSGSDESSFDTSVEYITDSESESDDEVDADEHGNLKGFVVDDDEVSEDESYVESDEEYSA